MSIIRFDFEIILEIINATAPNGHTVRLRSPESLAMLGTSYVRKTLSEIPNP